MKDNVLRISTPAGELCAYIGADEANPSVGIYLVPKNSGGETLDLAYAEVKGKELTDLAIEQGEDIGCEDVCLYTYADPYSEDYTSKKVIKRKDIIKAMEI